VGNDAGTTLSAREIRVRRAHACFVRVMLCDAWARRTRDCNVNKSRADWLHVGEFHHKVNDDMRPAARGVHEDVVTYQPRSEV